MRICQRPPAARRTTSRTARFTGPGPALGVALLLLAGLLAGCSGGGDDAGSSAGSSATSASAGSSSSSDSPTDSPSDSPSVSGNDTGNTSPAASDTASASTPSGSVASKTFSVTTTFAQLPATIRFDVVSLQRRDDLLQLVARVTNTSADRSKDMRWQIANRFDPDLNREDLGAYNGIFGGVVLTDVANKKRYLVAADSGKDCVCSSDLSGTFIGAGQSVDLVATYAAPPASTTKLDVEVPSLGLFRDLPIS